MEKLDRARNVVLELAFVQVFLEPSKFFMMQGMEAVLTVFSKHFLPTMAAGVVCWLLDVDAGIEDFVEAALGGWDGLQAWWEELHKAWWDAVVAYV